MSPIVNFKQAFKNTYLYGSYSPIDGEAVYKIEQVNCEIFEKYLDQFSRYRPHQYKIVVIDNVGFHSTMNIRVPDNIYLLPIPPYTPELNSCEQVWKYRTFQSMEDIKKWLHEFVKSMDPELIKSITSNHHYKNAFMRNI